MSGPPPKRDAERRRRNKPAVETTTVNLDELIAQEVQIPKPPMTNIGIRWVEDEDGRVVSEEYELDEPVPAWDPITVAFWESFSKSGQSIFYEPSDWMTIYTAMELLDRWLKPQDVKVGQRGSLKDEGLGGDIEYIFEPKIIAIPGSVLNAISKVLSSVMATEGDRRRLSIELERRKAMAAAAAGGSNVVPITQSRQERFQRES